MKRFFILFLVSAFLAPLVFADFQDVLDRSDELNELEDFRAGKQFITAALTEAKGGLEKSELYWRLARVYLKLGDEAEDAGASTAEILAFFDEGEELAQKAIDHNANNHLAYYWKSSNAGRWGQIKGILNSLMKAAPMRKMLRKGLNAEPNHADSYYVLGQLFEQVPGFPLSFGNKNYAVSLGRKSVDLLEQQVSAGLEDELNYDFYNEMAKHLWARDYSAKKRFSGQKTKKARYQSKKDIMAKNFYYEGVVSLQNISDQYEARELIAWNIEQLQAIPNRTDKQNDDLQEAMEIQAEFNE